MNSATRPLMKLLNRLLGRWLDYSARHHLKHRLRALDLKFIAAVAALAIGIWLAVRYV